MRFTLFISAALLCLSSCVKSYECNCVDHRTIDPKNEHLTINKANAGDAREKCAEYEQNLNTLYDYTCSIEE